MPILPNGSLPNRLRAAKHTETLARTKQLLNAANTDAERWLELAKGTFSSVTNLGEVFQEANDQERRQLMMFIGSNWYLGNKKVVLTPRKPLNLLFVSDRNPNWRARLDSADASLFITFTTPNLRFRTCEQSHV